MILKIIFNYLYILSSYYILIYLMPILVRAIKSCFEGCMPYSTDDPVNIFYNYRIKLQV